MNADYGGFVIFARKIQRGLKSKARNSVVDLL